MKISSEKVKLIQNLVSEGYLKSKRVIRAFRKVPREDFVLPKDRDFAYADYPLSIPSGQTISAPHMVAMMLELAGITGGEKILEVGAGSGYNAAMMAELAGKKGRVYATELDRELADFARDNLRKSVYENVRIIHSDGSLGLESKKPFDRVIVTCACHEVPENLLDQLKEGGLLLAPVGGPMHQELILIRKTKSGLVTEKHGGCVFVPLRH